VQSFYASPQAHDAESIHHLRTLASTVSDGPFLMDLMYCLEAPPDIRHETVGQLFEIVLEFLLSRFDDTEQSPLADLPTCVCALSPLISLSALGSDDIVRSLSQVLSTMLPVRDTVRSRVVRELRDAVEANIKLRDRDKWALLEFVGWNRRVLEGENPGECVCATHRQRLSAQCRPLDEDQEDQEDW
jgi:hypothetical protein